MNGPGASWETVLDDGNSLVGTYLSWLDEQRGQTGCDEAAPPATVVFDSQEPAAPFLSVIMRTQGERLEELAEALASLEGQSDRNFQLIVVGHNLDAAKTARVRAALDDLPEWLRRRCTFITVEGGSRSRPINAAFPHVKGAYFSALDEDDLAYDNWVSAFARLAKEHPSHLIYCFVDTQQWRSERTADGSRRLFAIEDGIGTSYCRHPDEFQLLFGNQCPFMGLAFPAQLIRELGLRFNESIETTEDWDFLMRARNVYPLASSDERVALYRLWSAEGGYSAQSIDKAQWATNEKTVRHAVSKMPLLFCPGFSELAYKAICEARSEETHLAERMEMYLDTGGGFNEQRKTKPVPVADRAGTYAFEDLARFGSLHAIRIDPQTHGPLAIAELAIEVHPTSGEAFTVRADSVATNGRFVAGHIEFPYDDPQIVVGLPSPLVVDRVVFTFTRANGFARQEDDGRKPLFGKRKKRSNS